MIRTFFLFLFSLEKRKFQVIDQASKYSTAFPSLASLLTIFLSVGLSDHLPKSPEMKERNVETKVMMHGVGCC